MEGRRGSAAERSRTVSGIPSWRAPSRGVDERFAGAVPRIRGRLRGSGGRRGSAAPSPGALHLVDRLGVAARPVQYPSRRPRWRARRAAESWAADLRSASRNGVRRRATRRSRDGRWPRRDRDEGAAEFGFGARAVAVEAEEDGAQGRTRLGEARVQLQGLARRRFGARIGLARRQPPGEGEEMDGVRQPRLRPRGARIEGHRLSKAGTLFRKSPACHASGTRTP